MGGEEELSQMEEMIEEIFALENKDSIDRNYLGKLLDDYKKLGGNAAKYQERYAKELN